MFHFRLSKLFTALAILGLVFAWLRLVVAGAFLESFYWLWACGLPGVLLFSAWRTVRALEKVIVAAALIVAWTVLAVWSTFLAIAFFVLQTDYPTPRELLLFPLGVLFPAIVVFATFIIRAGSWAWRDRFSTPTRINPEQCPPFELTAQISFP
jgi:hypothetical protein